MWIIRIKPLIPIHLKLGLSEDKNLEIVLEANSIKFGLG